METAHVLLWRRTRAQRAGNENRAADSCKFKKIAPVDLVCHVELLGSVFVDSLSKTAGRVL
jgi:hypothetical protein